MHMNNENDENDENTKWNCKYCTFLNHALLTTCEICHSSRRRQAKSIFSNGQNIDSNVDTSNVNVNTLTDTNIDDNVNTTTVNVNVNTLSNTDVNNNTTSKPISLSDINDRMRQLCSQYRDLTINTNYDFITNMEENTDTKIEENTDTDTKENTDTDTDTETEENTDTKTEENTDTDTDTETEENTDTETEENTDTDIDTEIEENTDAEKNADITEPKMEIKKGKFNINNTKNSDSEKDLDKDSDKDLDKDFEQDFYLISKQRSTQSIIANSGDPYDNVVNTKFNDTDCFQIVPECIICLNTKRSITFLCGHLCICKKCANNVKECPMCRRKGRKIQIYIV